MQVRCDACGKSFAPRLKERLTTDGGAEQRFRCPNCRKGYVVANITAKGLRIRQKLRKASPTQAPKLRRRLAQEVSRPV